MAKIRQEAVSLALADQDDARAAFVKHCARLDVAGEGAHLDAAKRGKCFKLTGPTGTLFYSVFRNAKNQLWIYAAAGTGRGLTEAGLYVIELQAKAAGCVAVAFQTLRKGLVLRAQRLGYLVTAQVGNLFVMCKAVA